MGLTCEVSQDLLGKHDTENIPDYFSQVTSSSRANSGIILVLDLQKDLRRKRNFLINTHKQGVFIQELFGIQLTGARRRSRVQ